MLHICTCREVRGERRAEVGDGLEEVRWTDVVVADVVRYFVLDVYVLFQISIMA